MIFKSYWSFSFYFQCVLCQLLFSCYFMFILCLNQVLEVWFGDKISQGFFVKSSFLKSSAGLQVSVKFFGIISNQERIWKFSDKNWLFNVDNYKYVYMYKVYDKILYIYIRKKNIYIFVCPPQCECSVLFTNTVFMWHANFFQCH